MVCRRDNESFPYIVLHQFKRFLMCVLIVGWIRRESTAGYVRHAKVLLILSLSGCRWLYGSRGNRSNWSAANASNAKSVLLGRRKQCKRSEQSGQCGRLLGSHVSYSWNEATGEVPAVLLQSHLLLQEVNNISAYIRYHRSITYFFIFLHVRASLFVPF